MNKYNYLIQNNLLASHQSGFRSLHSTVTALLDLTNQWCFTIDRGLVSGLLFLDLNKAFDKVDHQLLLTKFEYIGIHGHALEWFKSYFNSKQISNCVHKWSTLRESHSKVWSSPGLNTWATFVPNIH